MTRLSRSFFTREDVLQISRELLGKYLVTDFGAGRTAGRIVEVEAYRAPDDKASHAYGNRYTERTKAMFARGGHAYIYLCYGIHHLFNVVTGEQGMAHAVLIRALEPVENTALMLRRRHMEKTEPRLTAGPGVLSQAMGISRQYTGTDMLDAQSPIWIETREETVAAEEIIASPRIGVAYAEECAAWEWRFYLRGNRWVSKQRVSKQRVS
ncbi:MAG: DNA-3-methyladenine glycosylase [Lewinellaceae bacterium]|nr:DNA-3-methyladenine glycosylase [Phaeodactylibacter sp.]MCB9350980.1 DNA-3-methyladenine glycosylase [Lewinellaceae bacterium]